VMTLSFFATSVAWRKSWQLRSREVSEDDGDWSRANQQYINDRDTGKFRLYRGDDGQVYGRDSVRKLTQCHLVA
jgi:hypothetical protein